MSFDLGRSDGKVMNRNPPLRDQSGTVNTDPHQGSIKGNQKLNVTTMLLLRSVKSIFNFAS